MTNQEWKNYLSFGGDPNNQVNFARHLADRMSALEQNRFAARSCGDFQLVELFSKTILALRMEAKEHGLQPSEYPTLYR